MCKFRHILPASHPVFQLFVLLHEQVEFLLQISQLHAKGLSVCWLWTSRAKVKLNETEKVVKANVGSQHSVYRNHSF